MSVNFRLLIFSSRKFPSACELGYDIRVRSKEKASNLIDHQQILNMIILDSRAIQEILPHRYPFLLVDKIIELVPRERIVGIKQVTVNEHFFQGHFPNAPVMPGVLQIEAMAQVGAILALREFENRHDKIPFFSGIERARFRRPVVPGDTLTLEVVALRIGSKVQKMQGIARVDGQITAEAEIMCILGDRKKGDIK